MEWDEFKMVAAAAAGLRLVGVCLQQ